MAFRRRSTSGSKPAQIPGLMPPVALRFELRRQRGDVDAMLEVTGSIHHHFHAARVSRFSNCS